MTHTVIDLARALAATSPTFASTPALAQSFLKWCNWGAAISGDKQKDTNTLLALRGISNMFATKLGRRAISDIAVAGEVLRRLKDEGRWGEGGKWKMPAATVALK